MKIHLLVTSPNPRLSARRVEYLLRWAPSIPAIVTQRSHPGNTTPGVLNSTHSPLWSMALWGIHHASGGITIRAIQERLDYRQNNISETITTYQRAQYLQFVRGIRSGKGGMPQNEYALTPAGYHHAQGWITRMFNGYILDIEVKDGMAAEFREKLRQMEGIIVAPTDKAAPIPYRTATLALMLSWMWQQSDTNLTANVIAATLNTGKSNASKLLLELRNANLLQFADPETFRDGYRVTDYGNQLAYNYIARLLL